jgi:signal peptidase II
MKIKNINYYFWIVAIGSLALDIFSKQSITQNLQLMQSVPIIPKILNFTYVRNTGAAFSLFQGHDWLRWLSLIVSLALIVVGIVKPLANRWEQLGYGCILAGAMGNGIDRWRFGSVVDFIELKFIHFAVFNWADISINLGIIFLLIHTLVYQPSKPKRGNEEG